MSFVIAVLYGPVLHVVLFLIGMTWEPIEWIFWGFLGIGGGTLVLSVIDKMKHFGGKSVEGPDLESETH